jgi:uncharacterized protein YecE (DUF72 family)
MMNYPCLTGSAEFAMKNEAVESALNIGISGWRYAPWRGTFYPEGLVQRRELEFASRMLPTIEINGSFYSLQRPQSYASWYADTPEGFVFSVKAPRYISHMLRLRNIEIPMANFFASGLFNLREKLGPILWQFPSNFRFDAEVFESFLQILPRDTEQASLLARRHDKHIPGRAVLRIDKKRPLRYAVEFRSRTFVVPQFVELLRRYNIALVIADTAGKWPYYEDITADFIYLRLHGDVELYASGYSDVALERWARRIRAWQGGSQPDDAVLIVDEAPRQRASRPIFCYFDNDMKVRAPFDAAALLAKLGVDSPLLANPLKTLD